MWAGYTVRAWAGVTRPGRCRYCRRRIVWMVTDQGRWLPFDLGVTVRETVTGADGASFAVLDRADRHDCKAHRRHTRAGC